MHFIEEITTNKWKKRVYFSEVFNGLIEKVIKGTSKWNPVTCIHKGLGRLRDAQC